MPKGRKGQSSGASRSGFKADPIVKVHGNFLLADAAVATTVSSVNLNPLLLDARLVSLSDTFQEFRFTKVKVHMFCPSAGGPMLKLGYVPTITSATPTFGELDSLPIVSMGCGGAQGTPGPFPTIHIPRAELMANAPKWFRRGTAYDDLLESQGSIWYGSLTAFTTAPVYLWIEYDIELKANVAIALTSLPQLPAHTAEEKNAESLAQIERVLSMAPRVPNPRRAASQAASDRPVAVDVITTDDHFVILPDGRVAVRR